MKSFFRRNINNQGRIMRGLVGAGLFIGAGFGWGWSMWLGAILLAAGVFVLFEALRGWCALRACGIKTKI
jgi:hypothetical protein